MASFRFGGTPFKVGFPAMRLPLSHGGKPAIIIASLIPPAHPQMVLAQCLTIDGQVVTQVPIARSEIMKNAKRPLILHEVPDGDAPLGIISPDGTPLA